MLSRRFRSGLIAFLGALLIVGVQSLPAHADTNVAVPFKLNFGTPTTAPIAGYMLDNGAAYDAARGYGWTNTSDVPLNNSAQARERNLNPDKRLDTFIHMQLSPNPEAKWKAAIANGTYLVTVAVGDPQSINSHHIIHAEGTTVADFTPTSATKHAVQSAEVNVTDGFLNIDANGGTNTKIDYLEIVAVDPNVPHATGVDPANGAVGVLRSAAVTVQLSHPVDSNTLDAGLIIRDDANQEVAGHRNTDGAGSNATFTPSTYLKPNTTYTVEITSGLRTEDNTSGYEPFTSTFTTGTEGANQADVSFTRQVLDMQSGVTVMTMGPDGSLWAGTKNGEIFKYGLNAQGLMSSKTEYTTFKNLRTITGLRIDPTDPTVLWVSNADSQACVPNCSNFTGKISTLSGSNFSTSKDIVVGLPRANKDHMNNGIDFGPDGKLYLGQGSINGFGAPDAVWGMRAESPLNATVLQMDVHGDSRFDGSTPINVNTTSPNSYDPNAVNAPVKIWTEGIRNPFSILWGSTGKLYAVVNESASGNAPAGGGAPALNDLPPYNDYITSVDPNKYYGHPNPSRGNFILNGGNPTAGVDPFEVTQYPVGQQPNPNWRKPDFDLGLHRSSNGLTEFKSDIFGGALKGQLLATEYSQGDDIYAAQLDASGKVIAKTVVATGLFNPLGIATDAVSGRVYVGEYGQDPTGVNGQVSVLIPDAQPSDPTVVKKVNFQTSTTATPSGYTGDFGQAYDNTRGYGWENESTGTPLDITGNGRERNVDPDKRLDTFMHMQLPATASGVHTPAKWELKVDNGTYNVKVAVGDPSPPYNSTHVINAEGANIVPVFVASAGNTSKIVTANVPVNDGRLTIDAIGGANTKIDYIEVRTTDVTPPAVTATPSGTQNGSGEFEGSATFTINATDTGSGVATVSYTLDGGPSTLYTVPFTVNTPGAHTVVVTATDNAGNTTTPPVTSNFTVATAASFSKKINFGPVGGPVISGYTNDSGEAFDVARGWGWEDQTSGAPLSIVGNGRDRNLVTDQRKDTLMMFQATSGITTPAKWEIAVPNGSYNLTLGIGDPGFNNSVYKINAEGSQIVNFTPTTSLKHNVFTATVVVSDGRLTLDNINGTNGKFQFVDIDLVSGGGSPTPPVVTVDATGTTNGSGEYLDSATVSVNASDSDGVASVSYTLDGGAATNYTAPFAVSTIGAHTVVATATDTLGAVSSPVSKNFTVVASGGGATPFSKKINFGPVGGPVISGYTNDSGEAFDVARGWGWEDQTSGAPLSIVGNGRDRNLVTDQRKDTLMMFQATSGITTPAKWEIAVPNGSYNLTLGIGDPGFNNSVYKINAEGSQIVNFTPTTSLKHNVFTATAAVSDGRLTIDGIGSTNAKIQYIDIDQIVGGPTPPSVSVDATGSQDASNNYVNQATVTINATDTDGVASVSYTLDGGAATSYTAPFTVSTAGSHTVVATATDTLGATSSPVTKTFTIVVPPFNAAKINFGPVGGPVISGYTNDTGEAFDVTRGYGWENETTGAPLSLVGNGRDRDLVTDQRLDTLMQFQSSGGVTTRGKWEFVIPNGTYDVTLAVGDAGFTNSVHNVNIEGVNVVNMFMPTTATKFQTITTSVLVNDGRLTLDGIGGTNTKINYIDIIKPGADLTPPAVSISTSGTTDPSGSYVDSASVTINASDTGGSGVASRSYSLDGGAATNYTGSFTVNTVGTHTVVATATDNANNTSAPVTKTFDIVASGGGGTPSALEVITPMEFLGLGDRVIFSTVKNEVRPGVVITLKNNGGTPLNVTNLTFSGAQGGDFKLPTGDPTSFTINAGQTRDVTLLYRPTPARKPGNAEFAAPYTTNSYISKGALNIASNDPDAPTYQVTLGGLDSENYEGRTEPDLQEIMNAIGFKTTVGVTDWPKELGIGSQSGPAGEEVISAFWKKIDATKPVGMYPIAHYSGKDLNGNNSTTFGWYPKGGSLNTMYAFPGMNATADLYGNGYGENQLLFPRTTTNSSSTTITTNRTFNPSGSFGLFDGQGNRTLDTSNTGGYSNGNWHNFRFWPAKDAGGNVIPGAYIVGDDIGTPQRNGAKNWDYQDYTFLLTNIEPDGGNDQPVDPAPQPSLPVLEFNGTETGTLADSGFIRSEGAQNLAQVSVTGGQLRVLTNSDSNTAHTNMLNIPFNAATDFQIESRLVGPFDAINAGSEQQAIYFGHDATHYLKAEVENVSGVRKLTIYRYNGSSGVVAGQINLPGGNANTLDLRIQVVPSEFSIKNSSNVVIRQVLPYAKISYRIDSSDANAWVQIPVQVTASCTVAADMPGSGPTNCLSKDENGVNQVMIPDNWIRSKTYAGIITSHQGGGSQFTAVYENFKVQRWFR